MSYGETCATETANASTFDALPLFASRQGDNDRRQPRKEAFFSLGYSAKLDIQSRGFSHGNSDLKHAATCS